MIGLANFIKGIFSSDVSTAIFFIEVIMFSVDIFLYRIVYGGLKNIDEGISKKSFFGIEDMVEGYKDMISRLDYINTRSYIESYFSNYKYLSHNRLFNKLDIPVINIISVIHMTISVFILMGVLGTFTGLTISLNSLRTGEFTVDNISPILSGMGVAFYASIVGIAFSLILTFITRVFDAEQLLINIMVKLQNYMDNNLRRNNFREFFEKTEAAIKKLSASNDKTINEFGKISVEIMDKSLDTMEKVYEFVKKFSDFPKEFEKSMEYMTNFNKKLKESVEGFDLIFKGFSKLTSTLNKSMDNLDKKFDILDDCVRDINKGQKKVEKSYVDIYEKLDKLTYDFYASLDNLEGHQKNFLEEMKNLYEDIKVKYYEFKTYMAAYNEQKSEIFAQIYKDMKEYQSNHDTILNNIADKMEYFSEGYKK